jgi:hypothetical protein
LPLTSVILFFSGVLKVKFADRVVHVIGIKFLKNY